MSSHFYEVALFGEFFAQDLKPIVNRITLHSESSQQMHYREFVFEPIDAPQQRELGNEPVLLRARKEVTSPDSKWYTLGFLFPMLLVSRFINFCGCAQGVILVFEAGKCSSASGSDSPTMVDVGNRRGRDGVRICSGLHVGVVMIIQYLSQAQLSSPFPEGGLRYTNVDIYSAKEAWSSRCSNKNRFVLPHPRRQNKFIALIGFHVRRLTPRRQNPSQPTRTPSGRSKSRPRRQSVTLQRCL